MIPYLEYCGKLADPNTSFSNSLADMVVLVPDCSKSERRICRIRPGANKTCHAKAFVLLWRCLSYRTRDHVHFLIVSMCCAD